MEIDKVVKGVGYDGNSFFCWNCGKAGFATKQMAIGHQAQCKARVKVTSSLVGQSVGDIAVSGRSLVGKSVGRLVGEAFSQPDTFQQSDIEKPLSNDERHQIAVLTQKVLELEQNQSQYINEIPHLQAVQRFGFLGLSDNQLIFLLVAVVIGYMIGHETSCQCDISAGIPKRRLGSSIKDKVTDKAINYGINKLFK